eukprot:TRINITY_DN5458_c0_g1_i1.p1 TRINITY_DN5458_c0_g1~~TRINITY_DN5458_c0_g1_i1.p1  ORF type:complete len:399 (+),score=76.06 TRINITY_DN5458_c0_g1_i1:137-1333(+)
MFVQLAKHVGSRHALTTCARTLATGLHSSITSTGSSTSTALRSAVVAGIHNVRTLSSDAKTTKVPTRHLGFYRESHCHEPYSRRLGSNPVICTAEEAVKVIDSNMNVFVHSGSSHPYLLTDAMSDHGLLNDLKDIRVMAMHTEGECRYVDPKYTGIFRPHHFFISGNVRHAINNGQGDYVPIFLSEIPLLFRRNVIDLDVALVQVSPPDKHGFVTLGPNVDITRAALNNATVIIAQVNHNMPKTHGSSAVHMSQLDYMVCQDTPLITHSGGALSPEEIEIGKLIAENLVKDGATLQMGIGAVPDAVLAQLGDHKDLGIHTEMFSDGVLPLVEKGVITNAKKYHHAGKIVTSFVVGSERLYNYVDDNPLVEFHDASWVNDTSVIRQNPRVTAINSAIEV